jgi:hypothetical protein
MFILINKFRFPSSFGDKGVKGVLLLGRVRGNTVTAQKLTRPSSMSATPVHVSVATSYRSTLNLPSPPPAT